MDVFSKRTGKITMFEWTELRSGSATYARSFLQKEGGVGQLVPKPLVVGCIKADFRRPT